MINIPDFKTYAGIKFPIGSISKNDLRIRIDSTNEVEVRWYIDYLKENGYTLYAENSFSAGSLFKDEINLAYFLFNSEQNLSVFWDASLKTVFIEAESKSDFYPINKNYDKKIFDKIKFTQLKIVSGMQYVFQFLDGHFLIIDGGISNKDDEKNLFDFLIENSYSERPKIDWIFSHPDIDHIGLATDFFNDYANKVDINYIMYQFPDMEKINKFGDYNRIKSDIDNFETAISNNCKDAKVISLHTGDVYNYLGAKVEVIWSIDNTYPSYYLCGNDFSIALKITCDSGKIVTMLCDCMHLACMQINNIYGDYLKSDILQVCHHGLIGGDVNLYKSIDPDICFWPTSEDRFNGNEFGRYPFRWCLGEGGCNYNAYLRDEKIKKRKHYPLKETITLEI